MGTGGEGGDPRELELDVALSVIALIATVAFYYAFW